MKKIATILLAFSLLYAMSRVLSKTFYTDRPPATVIDEATFVNIVRDIELLNSWLLNKSEPQETIDILHLANYQKILKLYELNSKDFQESIKYYLETSSERALKVYEKVYIALKKMANK